MTSLQDLGLAYRKARVDLRYSSHASPDAIASYEETFMPIFPFCGRKSMVMTSPG